MAASALRPDMRRHAGSSTAVNARVPVMHSRASMVGTHKRKICLRSTGLGSGRVRETWLYRYMTHTAQAAANTSAAWGRAACMPRVWGVNSHRKPRDNSRRTVCSVASHRAGSRVFSRPQYQPLYAPHSPSSHMAGAVHSRLGSVRVSPSRRARRGESNSSAGISTRERRFTSESPANSTCGWSQAGRLAVRRLMAMGVPAVTGVSASILTEEAISISPRAWASIIRARIRRRRNPSARV